MAPLSRQLAPAILARGSASWRSTSASTSRPARIVSDQDRLRRLVVLGLRQKVGGDEARIGGCVGKDHHFARPRDHVDADDAEHPALGRRDIGVAGADDLVDRRDRAVPKASAAIAWAPPTR